VPEKINHPLRLRHRGIEKMKKENVSRISMNRNTVSWKFAKPFFEGETARKRRGPAVATPPLSQ